MAPTEEIDELRTRVQVALEVSADGLNYFTFEPGRTDQAVAARVAGEAIYGVPLTDPVEWPIEDIIDRVHPDDRGVLMAVFNRLGASDVVYGGEIRFRRQDGQYRWYEVRGKTTRFEDGHPVEALAIVHDVTARRELERQAAHGDKMRSLGYLMTAIGHDLNNLHAVVRANADLLLEPGLRENDRLRLAERLRETVDEATRRVAGMMAFSERADAAGHCELVALLGTLGPELSGYAPGVQFELSLADEPLPVRLAEPQAQQVVLSLCRNAIDAVEGSGRVAVTAQFIDLEDENGYGMPAGEYVVVTVADSGPGIDDKIVDSLFDPFVTTKPPGSGNGLGLALAFDAVNRVGGTIVAGRSALDGLGGAEFTVLVPRAPA